MGRELEPEERLSLGVEALLKPVKEEREERVGLSALGSTAVLEAFWPGYRRSARGVAAKSKSFVVEPSGAGGRENSAWGWATVAAMSNVVVSPVRDSVRFVWAKKCLELLRLVTSEATRSGLSAWPWSWMGCPGTMVRLVMVTPTGVDAEISARILVMGQRVRESSW